MELQAYAVMEDLNNLSQLTLGAATRILRARGFKVSRVPGSVNAHRQIFGQHAASHQQETVDIIRTELVTGIKMTTVRIEYRDVREDNKKRSTK